MSKIGTKFDANWALVALTVMSLLMAGWERYNGSALKQENRLTTVEAHEQDTAQRLDRMEDKLDTLVYYITGIHPTREDKPCPTCSTASIPR